MLSNMEKILTSYRIGRNGIDTVFLAPKHKEDTHLLQNEKTHTVSAVVLASKEDKDTHMLQDEKTYGQCCGSCFQGGQRHSQATR
jgi:hypothetical protein